ncbi:hypothetical protein ACFL6U_11585 [Planctomycetota bacterium]
MAGMQTWQITIGLVVLSAMRCCPLHAQSDANDHWHTFVSTDAGLVSLAHPRLSSESEVKHRLDICIELCRTPLKDSPPSRRETIRSLAQLYAVFAAETDPRAMPGDLRRGPGRRELLDLHQDPHPVVSRFTEGLGVDIPEGIIFLRWYASVNQMPSPIREAFALDAQTRAVTFLSRYVALLDEEGMSSPPEAVRSKRLQQVLGHELIHVALNTALGSDAFTMPRWFHEGCAISFSGTHGGQALAALTDTPSGLRFVTYHWNLPPDYQSYERCFQYLKHRLGTDAFYQQLSQSIQQRSVSSLLQSVAAVDYQDLDRQARQWRRQRDTLIWLGATLVLSLFAFTCWLKLPRHKQRPQDLV